MIQYQNTDLGTEFEPPVTLWQKGAILQKYGDDVTIMASSS